MNEIWDQLPKGNVWLLVQAALAVWAAFNLVRSFRTGEARFRVVGHRQESPKVFWALILFWTWLLGGALAYVLLIVATRF